MPKMNNEKLMASEIAELTHILDRKHAASLGDRFFSIKVDSDESKAFVTVTLRNAGESFYYPVEGRIACKSQELSPKDGAMLLLDFIDVYFEEFFHDRQDTWLPIDWAGFNFEGFEFELKGQVLNKRTEELADLFLDGKINRDEIISSLK
ncbi:MAG: hypothetical protein WCI18_05260 [Pseudomonadota bacterium]